MHDIIILYYWKSICFSRLIDTNYGKLIQLFQKYKVNAVEVRQYVMSLIHDMCSQKFYLGISSQVDQNNPQIDQNSL